MKEQLISFDTAKLAKEKRFSSSINEQVEFAYVDGNIEKTWSYNSNETEITSNRISAPTQSLLQKWLRDVHNVHVNPVISNVITGIYICNIRWWRDHFSEQSLGSGTYEEALEKGLQEALKLIK